MKQMKTKASPARRAVGLLINKNYTLVYILILFAVIFSNLGSGFFTPANLNSILISQVTVGFMAIGAMLILIVSEFDLSLGYMIGFLMVLGAFLSEKGAPVAVVIPVMLAVGGGIGLVSGVLTVKFNISSFISTLAVGIALQGAALGITGGKVLSKGIPSFIITLGQGKALGLGICVWLFLAVLGAMFLVMEYTRQGRFFYAVGGSARVAYMAGVKTGAVKISAFALAGVFTGAAAVVQLGQSGSAFPSFGSSLLMPAYAIAFLSAAAFKAGKYNVAGLVLAVVVLGIGSNGLNIAGAPWWSENLYNGLILIFAILLSNFERRAHGAGGLARPKSG